MKNGLMVAVLMMTGCGVSQSELADSTDLQGQEGAELSTTSRTYVTFTRDFRKCVSPMCGGYFVTDLNRVNATAHYVSGFDFSAAGLDDATVTKALEGGSATILRGKLGAEDSRFHTRPFLISDAWRGMPGVNVAAGDAFYFVASVNIQCIKAPCPSMRATKLNAGGATLFHKTDVSGAALPRVDQSWLTSRLELDDAIAAAQFTQGALVSGTREKVLSASQVFVKLPEAPGPCPAFRLMACPNGQVRTFVRNANRCELPGACVTPGVCALFLPACAEDYTLQSWSGGQHACPTFACDPTFSL